MFYSWADSGLVQRRDNLAALIIQQAPVCPGHAHRRSTLLLPKTIICIRADGEIQRAQRELFF